MTEGRKAVETTRTRTTMMPIVVIIMSSKFLVKYPGTKVSCDDHRHHEHYPQRPGLVQSLGLLGLLVPLVFSVLSELWKAVKKTSIC